MFGTELEEVSLTVGRAGGIVGLLALSKRVPSGTGALEEGTQRHEEPPRVPGAPTSKHLVLFQWAS